MRIYALVTDQGTAAPETAVCAEHFHNDETRSVAKNSASEDVDRRGWLDCSENELLACVICGAASKS